MVDPNQWLDTGLKITEFLVFIGGGGALLWKLGRAVGKFEEVSERQSKEITELKDAMKSTSEAVIKIAVQNQRLDEFGTRFTRMENMIDDLRRGEGIILPLNPRTIPNER